MQQNRRELRYPHRSARHRRLKGACSRRNSPRNPDVLNCPSLSRATTGQHWPATVRATMPTTTSSTIRYRRLEGAFERPMSVRSPARFGSGTPIGISEGAVGCQPACVSSWRFFGAAGAADPGSSWWLGAPAKAVGSRWSARSRRRGRTTLTPPPGGADWSATTSGQLSSVVDRPAPVFASGSSGWRWLRWAGSAARHLFVPLGGAHDAIEATTTVGLNQFADAAGVAPGVMPFVELAIRGRVRTVMPPRRVG